MAAVRAAKQAARNDAAFAATNSVFGGSGGLTAHRAGTWAAYNTAQQSADFGLTAADKSALDVTNLVPVRKTTTWSLGTF